MALKDQVVELVLRARNLLSSDTEKAAQSIDDLAGNIDGLQGRLRELQDQAALIKQFDSASKAVDRTSAAYDRAQLRLDKLKAKLGDTGPLTEAQSREFTAASRAVEKASQAYDGAQEELRGLSNEAEKAGIDVTNLSAAKRENAQQTTAAKRAIEDYNEELARGDGRLKALGKSLAAGAASMAKWATAAAAAGAALAATAITRLTTNQADLARQTLASAEAFGVSAVALQKWQYAAEQVGIGGEKTADILKDVSEKIGDAFATGGGEAAEVIDRLNLSVEDLVRLSPDQQILKISEQLTGMPKSEQIQVLESLASDASLLLPLLDNNAEKLSELSSIAQQRGDILTEDELERLAAFDAAFERVKTAISGVFKQVAVNLAPAFETLAEKVDEAIGSQPELIEKISGKIGALVQKVTDLASSWANSTSSMSSSFSPFTKELEGTRQLFIAMVAAIQTVGATVAEVVARANYDWKSLALGITEVMNKIGLASDESVVKARLLRDVAAESVRDLDKQADEYLAKMKTAGAAAATAFSEARNAASQAARETRSLGDAAGEVGEKASEAGKIAPKFAQAGEAAKEAAKKVAALVQEITALESREEAKAKLTELTQLLDAGKITADEYANALLLLNAKMASLGKGTADRLNEVSDSARGAAESIREVGDAAEESASRGGGAFAIMTGAISGYLSQMDALGANARTRFIELASGVKQSYEATDEFSSRVDELEQRLKDLREQGLRTFDATGIQGALQKLGESAAKTELEFLQQKKAMQDLQFGYDSGAISARQYAAQAAQMVEWSNLLDEQDLSTLRGGIEQARRSMASLREQTASTVTSLRDELDRLQGNTDAIREREYRQQIAELEAQLDTATRTRDEEAINNARESLRLAKEINAIESKRSDHASRPAANSPSVPATQSLPAASQARTIRLELVTNGSSAGSVDLLDNGSINQLIAALERAGLVANRG